MKEACGTDIESYKIPITDTQKSKRNFPGYKESEWMKLAELQEGDTDGSTDSDLRTHKMAGKNSGGGYTKIYSKGNNNGR